MTSPSVSIIIPTHNRGELLMETIASVRAQTAGDFEAIVVDDHSTDDTSARLQSVLTDDARFRLIQLADDQRGAQAARNAGIERAAGRYVVLLDSDDLLAPHCLQQRVPLMDADAHLDFAVFPCECFRKSPGDVSTLWNVPTPEDDLDRFLKGDVPWQTTSPIWRRAAIGRVMPWPVEVKIGQDWEFHIRAVLAELRYRCVGEVDHYWRMAEADRESIGKQTMKPELLRSRVDTNERVTRLIREAGKLTEARRKMLAGLFLQSAERIGTRVGWRDGLAVWKRARTLDLITDGQLAQGKRYFWLYRFKKLRAWYRSRLERAWPAEYFVQRSPTYLKAPLPAKAGQ